VEPTTIVVEGVVAVDPKELLLREEMWEIALDQQAFGPCRLLVATADRAGHLLAIAHTVRTVPPELALACCLDHLGRGAAAAVAFSDEPVSWGPPPPDLGEKFAIARETAAAFGVHLLDWLACDFETELFRSTRIALEPGSEWWDLP
jgi:hypothetical protein